MPSNAPAMKLAATRGLGAEVVLYDRVSESRDAVAAKLLDERGGTLVHAYGDPWIIEGQGSAGIEAAAQMKARGIDGPDKVIACCGGGGLRSEEHTSELQSLMRISYAVFCLKKKKESTCTIDNALREHQIDTLHYPINKTQLHHHTIQHH